MILDYASMMTIDTDDRDSTATNENVETMQAITTIIMIILVATVIVIRMRIQIMMIMMGNMVMTRIVFVMSQPASFSTLPPGTLLFVCIHINIYYQLSTPSCSCCTHCFALVTVHSTMN